MKVRKALTILHVPPPNMPTPNGPTRSTPNGSDASTNYNGILDMFNHPGAPITVRYPFSIWQFLEWFVKISATIVVIIWIITYFVGMVNPEFSFMHYTKDYITTTINRNERLQDVGDERLISKMTTKFKYLIP